jgi:hypothetical protein
VLPCVLPTCVSVPCTLPVPLAPSCVRPAWCAPHATPIACTVSRSSLCPPSASGLALWPSADECASVLRAGHVPGDEGVQADNALDAVIDDDEEGPMSATPCMVLTGDVAVATRCDAGDGPRNKLWPSCKAGWSAPLLASHVASLDKPRLSRPDTRRERQDTRRDTSRETSRPNTSSHIRVALCASLAQLLYMHTPPVPTPPWHACMGPSHTQHPHSSSAHAAACTHTHPPTHPPTHTYTHFVNSSSLGSGKNTHTGTEPYMIWPHVCTRQLLPVLTSHVCARQMLPHVATCAHVSYWTVNNPLICVRHPRALSFTPSLLLARSLACSLTCSPACVFLIYMCP